MPVISSFYGIDIKLYFRDHFPPHFHAFYGEFSAEISIHDLRVLAGGLPRRAMSLVGQWAELHRAVSGLLVGPVFDEIRRSDEAFARVTLDGYGSVGWPNGADLDPWVLYELATSETAAS